MTGKSYYILNHQNKAKMFDDALETRFRRLLQPPADLVFTDQAIYGRIKRLELMKAYRYFMYPHSAKPNIIHDIEPMWDGITAEFVATEGHKEIMRMYGHDKPIHVTGWHLCELKSYYPRKVENVLFAPIHPRCHEIDKGLNRETFDILRKLDIKLTVRYIDSLEGSGLEMVEQPNITYTQGSLAPEIEQIDKHAVVVAYETFAYLAIARGVPTVMFGEDVPVHLIPYDKPTGFPKNWGKYLPFLRYPLDIRDGYAMDILERAAKSDEEISGWRYRMIGDRTFDERKFISQVERYL